MGHTGDNIDISPAGLMKAVWELPSTEGGKLEGEGQEAHARGMSLVRKMIEAGADQSQAAPFYNGRHATTPIIIAAANNDVACLAFLLSAPFANPNFVDEDGETALLLAAHKGNFNCVAMLAPICDPNIKDSFGRTALEWAMARGHSESVAILAPITDLVARNGDGETARDYAQRHETARQYIPLLDAIMERPLLAAAVAEEGVEPAARLGRKRSL